MIDDVIHKLKHSCSCCTTAEFTFDEVHEMVEELGKAQFQLQLAKEQLRKHTGCVTCVYFAKQDPLEMTRTCIRSGCIFNKPDLWKWIGETE